MVGAIGITIIIGIVLMISIPFVLYKLGGGGSKKNNIRYVITQTFEGGSKTYILTGRIEKWKSDIIAEHKIVKGNQEMSIGHFHQKYLQPSNNDKFLMYLEEYDTNRFRPMMPGQSAHKERVPKLDDNNDIERDEDGNIKYTTQEVKDLEYVPNNDINWMITSVDRVRKFTESKKKSTPWKEYLVGAGLLFLVICGMFVSLYFQYEMFNEGSKTIGKATDSLANNIDKLNPESQQKILWENIQRALKNETIRSVVKPEPEKDSNAPPGAE
ncbi:MAG: hypothetical protein R6U11_07720 [Bacteroidales bacterium]